jgi:hypothetical protein
LAKHKKHLAVPLKSAGRSRVHDFPAKPAALGNQQTTIGREQGAGDFRFHRFSSSGGPGSDWMEQASVDFPILRLGGGRVIRWPFGAV